MQGAMFQRLNVLFVLQSVKSSKKVNFKLDVKPWVVKFRSFASLLQLYAFSGDQFLFCPHIATGKSY